MRKRTTITVALVLGGVALAAPVIASVRLARRQAVESATANLTTVANDIMRRTIETREQALHAAELLSRDTSVAPCSDQKISLMREIDVSSSYIQAVGHVSDDHLMCSSLGRHSPGIYLGKPSTEGVADLKAWIAVELPFAKGHPYFVAAKDGWATVIHRELAIDVFAQEPAVSVAVIGLLSGKLLASRGVVEPGWVSRAFRGHESSFADGSHLIAISRSDSLGVASLAAIPLSVLNARVWRFAARLLPIGLVASLVLGGAILQLMRQQSTLEAALESALRHNEFCLLYQPIVDLRDGRCVGAEALVRWRRKDGTYVRPDVFIPVAEERHLIAGVTARVMEMVARDTTEFLRRHRTCHIAINLSSADLASPDLLARVQHLVTTMGVEPHNIMVEACERGLLDTDTARQIIASVRHYGSRVAIDDFGTGYSSLAYLAKYELDYLKIAKPFVDTLGTDAATNHVAFHIIEMAKSLRLEMIAEGVETQAQAALLRERGVEFAQGNLFGKPMPIADVEALVESRAANAAA